MGYSWVYMGDGSVPSEARERWLAESTDPLPYADTFNALDGFLIVEDEAAYDDLPVKEAFEALAECTEVCRVETDEAVTVRALADKSGDAWLTYRWNVAVAFASLAKHGGRGRLDVVGFDDGPDDGFRVEIADGAVTARVLDEDEVRAVRESDAYRQVLELAEAAFSE